MNQSSQRSGRRRPHGYKLAFVLGLLPMPIAGHPPLETFLESVSAAQPRLDWAHGALEELRARRVHPTCWRLRRNPDLR